MSKQNKKKVNKGTLSQMIKKGETDITPNVISRVNNHFNIKSNSLHQANVKSGYVLNEQISIIDYGTAKNLRKGTVS